MFVLVSFFTFVSFVFNRVVILFIEGMWEGVVIFIMSFVKLSVRGLILYERCYVVLFIGMYLIGYLNFYVNEVV